MNEQLKQKAGLIYNVVESVVLAMSVGLMVWLSNLVISHGNVLAGQANELQNHKESILRLETKGSPQLFAHESQDDQRIAEVNKRLEKLEAAVIALQAAPGELKAINARLDGLAKSTDRIEAALREHVAEKKP